MNQHREAYREEAYELLTELEAALLELEEAPDDQDLIGRVFRAMHTIKGSGAMFGFDDIAEFTHEIETVYDRVREGAISVTKALVDMTLWACDQIKKMVDGNSVEENLKEGILDEFRKLLPSASPNGGASAVSPLPSDQHSATSNEQPATRNQEPATRNPQQPAVTYRIRFRPVSELFATGTNPILLLDELRTLGPHHITAQTDRIPSLEDMDPESCYLYWDMVLTTPEGMNAIKDVFIFVADSCKLKIDVIDEEAELTLETDADYKRLGEILVERGDLGAEALRDALMSQPRLGEVLQRTSAVSPGIIDSALAEQQQVKEGRKKRRNEALASSVRVGADKLDTLVDLVGELVTVQARLSQKAGTAHDSDLLNIAEEVERLTAELRDNTMGIRMMPIGATFSKFKRLVRDLSSELGKEVQLTTEGSETELDKTVIERLNDPLVHIIRNSIDHGIEPAEVRTAAGKHRQGTVHLSAVHSGAHVLIKISDDGKGLDAEAIRAKAVEKGLLSPDADPSEGEIFSQIFAAGFSTAKTVTDVSGRGVGMDVVKRSVEGLRGSIEIDSVLGAGTTITLKLPLTLAIIDGLLVKIGNTNFVIPLSSVEECVELRREEAMYRNGRHIMKVRGEIVPFVPLRELFAINGKRPPIEQIVIAELESQRIGFVVDEIIGQHQTVIKNLGKAYKDARCFSGATILADGTVALIMDVQGLSDVATIEERGVG
jgi:two-component system, chemotaxis family, sensor kinase CheA